MPFQKHLTSQSGQSFHPWACCHLVPCLLAVTSRVNAWLRTLCFTQKLGTLPCHWLLYVRHLGIKCHTLMTQLMCCVRCCVPCSVNVQVAASSRILLAVHSSPQPCFSRRNGSKYQQQFQRGAAASALKSSKLKGAEAAKSGTKVRFLYDKTIFSSRWDTRQCAIASRSSIAINSDKYDCPVAARPHLCEVDLML